MTAPQVERVEEVEVRLRAVRAFLDGSDQLDSRWFGDTHPTKRGKFWWRSEHLPVLDEAASLLSELRKERDEAREENAKLHEEVVVHGTRAEEAERLLEGATAIAEAEAVARIEAERKLAEAQMEAGTYREAHLLAVDRGIRLEAERDEVRAYFEELWREQWSSGYGIDGADMFDLAEKHGLLVEVPASEEVAREYDTDTMLTWKWSALLSAPETKVEP